MVRSVRACLFLAVLLIATAGAAAAQTVAGQLREIGSGRPIVGASVTLLDTLDAELAMMASDTSGAWVIDAPGPGHYRIHVRRGDYYTVRSAIFMLEPGQTRRFRLDVPLPPIALDPVEAEAQSAQYENAAMAGFNERRREYNGTFITRADLARLPMSMPVPQLLREQPGIRLSEDERFASYIEMTRRACPAKIVVNGVTWVRPPIEPKQEEFLREFMDLRVDDIEAIEIYRGASQVPPIFGGSDAECGVIVAWLRTGR